MFGRSNQKGLLGRSMCLWTDNLKTNLTEVKWEGLDCLFALRINKAGRDFLKCGDMPSAVVKWGNSTGREFLASGEGLCRDG